MLKTLASRITLLFGVILAAMVVVAAVTGFMLSKSRSLLVQSQSLFAELADQKSTLVQLDAYILESTEQIASALLLDESVAAGQSLDALFSRTFGVSAEGGALVDAKLQQIHQLGKAMLAARDKEPQTRARLTRQRIDSITEFRKSLDIRFSRTANMITELQDQYRNSVVTQEKIVYTSLLVIIVFGVFAARYILLQIVDPTRRLLHALRSIASGKEMPRLGRLPDLQEFDDLSTIVREFSDSERQRRGYARTIRMQSAALDSANSGIIMTGTLSADQRMILYVNRRFTEMLKLRESELVGQPMNVLEPLIVSQSAKARIRDAMINQKSILEEIEVQRADGKPLLLQTSLAPIIDESGEISGFLASMTDLTELKRIERAMQQASQMESLGQLTGAVAHEFNNLLTVVTLNGEMLASELEENSEQHSSMTSILLAAQQASELTRRLLAFTKNQPHDNEINSVESVFNELSSLYLTSLSDRIKVVIKEVPQDVILKANRHLLMSSLMNLVINAADAMPDGGTLTLRCEVRANASPGDLPVDTYVCLSVTDTGQGISSTVIDRIFEPFFTTKGATGHGLGLSMVYNSVRAAGGTVTVTSRQGHGTTFELWYPRIEDAATTATVNVDHSATALGRREILLVDDNREVCAAVGRTVATLGHNVRMAHTVESALNELRTWSVDLLITDIGLGPDASGYDLVRLAREIQPDLPVVFITGYISASYDVPEAMRKETVLTKPPSAQQLHEAIRDQIVSMSDA